MQSLQQQQLAWGCRHLANSAGTLRGQDLHYDMVRVGLALYGHSAPVLEVIDFIRADEANRPICLPARED